MKLILHSFTLPHRHAFTIARETKTEQRTFIVELQHNGQSGYGESAEDKYYDASIENMATALRGIHDLIESQDPENPELLWENVHGSLTDHPFALCALDMAAHDLNGKLKGKALWDLWGLDTSKNVLTDYTVGIDSSGAVMHVSCYRVACIRIVVIDD